MINITDIEAKIRDLINKPRKQYALIREAAKWNKLTSSLDIIGDTELAIEAFQRNDWPKEEGSKYLLLYGILQALFLQQDAVKNISEALDYKFYPDPSLEEVREIRHDSVGHPSKRERKGKEIGYNFILRGSISRNGFTLMKTFPDGIIPEFININLPSLIDTQRFKLAEALKRLLDVLKEEEMEHRKMFKDERLEELFPIILGYYFQKLSEAIYGIKPLGLVHAKLIQEIINNFKMALEKRGIMGRHIQHTIDLINYPLSELILFFEKPEESILNERSAYIFIFFVEKQMKSLKELAKEIDSEYSSDLLI